ncbi:MAG: ABC transporter permease [Burkholderiales bacterium]|nr:ABC transporter permease [Burkholderiales bacterium]
MAAAWIVYLKELVDALRDRRTLMTVLLSSVAMGPLVLLLLSSLVGAMEKRAEAREVVVAGIEHAPTLANYIARQTYTVRKAPVDYEDELRKSQLGDPVVVVPADFEAGLQRAEPPLLAVVSSSSNQRAQAGHAAVLRLLRGFSREQATLRLALRGVAPLVTEPIRIEERDLADAGARAAQLTKMVPFFVLMAVLYGALNAALDSTAGERERGSLEPLLMNPAALWALVLGKWAAVASVAMLVAVLSCASFLPGQWLLRSETLAALFRFGVHEAAWFIALLAPLAGAVAALLMAVAIRCKSVKEAQANATVIMLAVTLAPMVTLFNQEGERPWHLWVPALAQMTLMSRVLEGAALPLPELLASLVSCALLAALALGFVAQRLRRAAVG